MIAWIAAFVLVFFFWRAFPKMPIYQQIICLVLAGFVVWGLIIPIFTGMRR